MAPVEIFVIIWFLEDGHTLPVIASKDVYEEWRANRRGYHARRIARFNSERRGGARLAKAVDMTVARYTRRYIKPEVLAAHSSGEP